MITPSTPFDYDATESEQARPPTKDERDEYTRELLGWINRFVFVPPRNGAPLEAKTIVARWISLRLVLGAESRALRECANEAKCTPANISKLAREYSKALDIVARWQR